MGGCRAAAIAVVAFISLVACEDPPGSTAGDGGARDDAAEREAGAGDAPIADAVADSGAPDPGDATEPSDTGETDAGLAPTDAEAGDAGTGPIARDQFCDAFIAAHCGAVSACACPPNVITRCEPAMRALCTDQILSRSVRAKIDDGTILYDGLAARSFVDRLAETSSTCANPVTGIGWTAGDYFTIGGIFGGTLPAGARCTIAYGPLVPSECARGVCLEEGGNYQCLPLAIPGELCDGAGLCTDLSAGLDPSLSIGDNLASPCTASSSISPSLCSARFADGAACAFDFECASLHCDGAFCTQRREAGDMCLRDAECKSGDCGAVAEVCEAGELALGMTCDRGPSCDSDVCIQNTCAPAVCAGFAE